jgi:hypothetical protein
LNTTSPTVCPEAPIEMPLKTVPSANTKMAGIVFDTLSSLIFYATHTL